MHERVEGGEVFEPDVWAIGIHSIVARCLGVTTTKGESEAAALWAAADPCAFGCAGSIRDVARERAAHPKDASNMFSEGLGLVPGSTGSLTSSGGPFSIDRHVGLSAAQCLEQVVRSRTSVKERSQSCRVAWPICKTAMKTISVDGKRTEPALLKITPRSLRRDRLRRKTLLAS